MVKGYHPSGVVTLASSPSNIGTFSPSGQCTLSSGNCFVTFTGTTPEKGTVTASYGGDSNNSASSGSVAITVEDVMQYVLNSTNPNVSNVCKSIGGTWEGNTTCEFSGTVTLSIHEYILVLPGSVITNDGTVYDSAIINDSGGNMSNSGVIYIEASGGISNSAYKSQCGAVTNIGSITNLGNIRNFCAFTNVDTITNLDGSRIDALGGTITNEGTITNNPGGVLVVDNGRNDTLSNSGTIRNDGILDLYGGGTVSVSGNWPNWVFSGSFSSSGYLSMVSGSTLAIGRGGTGTTLEITPGSLTVVDTGVTLCVNKSSGVLVDTGASLENKGQLIIQLGGNVTNNGAFNNEASGTVTNNGDGTIVNKVNGTVSNWGKLVFDTSDTVTNSGHLVLDTSGTVTNSGLLADNGIITDNFGSTITNTASGTIASKFGGSIANSGIIINNGFISTSSGGSIINNPGGTINNVGGTIFDNSGGSIINNPGGTINNRLNGDIEDAVGSTIVSAGTVVNWGTITSNGVFIDNGTITNNPASTITDSGAITVNGLLANSGSITSSTSYSTITNNGAITNNETITISGTFTNDFDGAITNSGTIMGTGNVVNNGTVINNSGGTIDTGGQIVNEGVLYNCGGKAVGWKGNGVYIACISAQALKALVTSGSVSIQYFLTTGMSVSLSGTNGMTIGISTAQEGSQPQPSGTPNANLSDMGIIPPQYFDLSVFGANNGTAYVCIYNTAVGSTQTVIEYYSSDSWNAAKGVIDTAGSNVCGNIPVAALTGTPLVIGNSVSSTTTSSTTPTSSSTTSTTRHTTTSTRSSTTSTSSLSTTLNTTSITSSTTSTNSSSTTTITSTETSSSSTVIPEFPYQLLMVFVLTTVVVVSYLIVRHKARALASPPTNSVVS